MLEQFHYDSDLIGGSLMVRESRLIADLFYEKRLQKYGIRPFRLTIFCKKELRLRRNAMPLPFVSAWSA